MDNEPIFIVGVPRSGTTLLAAMLAAHSRISCGPETHFFRKLARVDADRLVMPGTWPEAALDFVCSIEHASFSDSQRITLVQKYQIDREQIAAYLRQREPSIPNILASVTDQYRMTMGKVRWAEKTPDHLITLPQVRKYFPDAPVIQIIRDPRDVAISLTKVPWGAMSYLEALLLWKRLDEESAGFFQTDQRSYSLRFEDLITTPEAELTRLCGFIGEEFEPGMLDTSETGRQLNARHVAWKEKVRQPVDASRQAVWKTILTREDNQLAEAILGGRMVTLGYSRVEAFTQLGEVYPSFPVVTKYYEAIKSLASSGVRFWQASQDEKATVKIYLGDPMNEGWLPGNKVQNILDAFSILLDNFKASSNKQTIYWVPGSQADAWSGVSAFFLKKALTPHQYPTLRYDA